MEGAFQLSEGYFESKAENHYSNLKTTEDMSQEHSYFSYVHAFKCLDQKGIVLGE